MNQELEYRMYGFVPYNISDIQKGIQFGHAVQEYNNKFFHFEENNDFIRWRTKDKTFIILNGGTTGTQPNLKTGLPHGTMNQHLLTLQENGIKFAAFYEEDMGNQLLGICFLVDNRVYDNFKLTPMDLDPHESWFDLLGNEKNEFLHGWLPQLN